MFIGGQLAGWVINPPVGGIIDSNTRYRRRTYSHTVYYNQTESNFILHIALNNNICSNENKCRGCNVGYARRRILFQAGVYLEQC